MRILIGQLGNPSYCVLRLRDRTPTLTVIHFSFDILMTWSPECDTHTYLIIGCNLHLSILSTSPLLLIILSTHFPPVLVSTVAVIIFGGNGIFICDVLGSVWRGSEEKKMKMKTEDARKKLQDWRYGGVVGMGWQYWTTFMIVIQRSSSWVLAMATVHSKLARKSLVLRKALCRHGEAADATLVPSCGFLLGIKKAGLACLPPMSTNRM